MQWFLAILAVAGLIQNGDFSQGATAWNLGTGWQVTHGQAVFNYTNTTDKEFAKGGNLCSVPYPIAPTSKILTGSAQFEARDSADNGYAFFGTTYYDRNGKLMETDMLYTTEGKPLKVKQTATFKADVPDGAKQVAFCVFAGSYYNTRFRVRVDNVSLQ